MDNKLVIQMQNYADMVVLCEPHIRNELRDYLTFQVPGYKFMPAYKRGVWDGKIRLFNTLTCEVNVGLYYKIVQFAKQRAYMVELRKSKYGLPNQKNTVDHQSLVKFISNLQLPFEMRDYQYDAVSHAIENKRCILVSPTGSGKSLIIYTLARWYLAKEEGKILIIVPTTSLVEQLYSNFKDDYGWQETEETCHKIYSGKDKKSNKKIFISTWQSIHKLSADFFDQFGCVLGDECHGFKAKSLSSIMNKSVNAEYRYGTTGTLDNSETNQLVLEGLFGPVKKVTQTKKLQDRGDLAALNIDIVVLEYSNAIKKAFSERISNYQEEMDFIVRFEKRNKFITDLAMRQKGNTLVLFQFVEKHGEILYNMIKDKTKEDEFKDMKAYYVHGDIKTTDREAIREIVDRRKDGGNIIVASLGTFSTGIDIRNLHNIIFASSTKAQIRVLQSIGRGLRLAENNQATKLYDITDNLSWNGRANYTLSHHSDRMKIYDKEQFNYKIRKVVL